MNINYQMTTKNKFIYTIRAKDNQCIAYSRYNILPKYELRVLFARSKVKISSMAFPVDDTISTPLLEHGQDILAGKVGRRQVIKKFFRVESAW